MEIPATLLTFLLSLIRIGSYFVSTPVFSMKQIPKLVKLGLVVIISYLTWLTIGVISIEVGTSFLELGLVVLKETLVGLMLGMVSNLVFLGIQSAGDFIDFFAGLKMASNYDPITGVNSSLYSTLYNWLGAILFLMMNGHHYLIRGIVNSFNYLPIGTFDLAYLKVSQISIVLTKSFLVALQLAIPICVILFLVDIILGLISRSVPQINVFILGMPLKLLVSFGMIFLIISGIIQSVGLALDSVIQILNDFVKMLG